MGVSHLFRLPSTTYSPLVCMHVGVVVSLAVFFLFFFTKNKNTHFVHIWVKIVSSQKYENRYVCISCAVGVRSTRHCNPRKEKEDRERLSKNTTDGGMSHIVVLSLVQYAVYKTVQEKKRRY